MTRALLSAAALAAAGASLPVPPWQLARGDGPLLLGEGVISTPLSEFSAVFSPDGRRALWTLAHFATGFTILESEVRDGRLGPARVASFSGRFDDADPFIAADGGVFFVSRRPLHGEPVRSDSHRLWRAERSGAGWSEPRALGPPVDPPGPGVRDWHPSVSADGTLFFASQRDGSAAMDLYAARRDGAGYGAPEKLPAPLSRAELWDIDPYVAPDGSYLIFASAGREDGFGGFDLYASFRRAGGWSAPRNLGPLVNSAADEMSSYVSPDGEVLIFASLKGFGDAPESPAIAHAALLGRVTGAVDNGYANLYRIRLRDLGVAGLPR